MKVLRGRRGGWLRSDGARFATGLLVGLALWGLARSRRRHEVDDRRGLDTLEERVLNAFLADEVLSGRAIDIEAVSPGIIELTGAIASAEEMARAVRVARSVEGVLTVVDRLVTPENGLPAMFGGEGRATFSTPEGRVVGMGRRRQSPETDPGQPDDSRKLRDRALAAADRDQWEEEE